MVSQTAPDVSLTVDITTKLESKTSIFTGAQPLNNQSQNQPAASLAAALAPFLQQNGGIQNLQGLLAGQLQPNAAPQNNLNPAAQLNPMDQVRIPPSFILALF